MTNFDEISNYISLCSKEIFNNYGDDFSAPVYKNEISDYKYRSKFHKMPIIPTDSRYYVEAGTYDNDEDTQEFKEKIVELIILLRSKYNYVVASCDFEDFIIDNTGWNWNSEHPYPS